MTLEINTKCPSDQFRTFVASPFPGTVIGQGLGDCLPIETLDGRAVRNGMNVSFTRCFSGAK